ncbi:MAG: hypothetical protein K1X77_11705 [Bacteroidia bacterium]|nr:hypothetical protein [Bacteroidia bacterium]
MRKKIIMSAKWYLCSIAALLLILNSCSNNPENIPDVSKIEVSLQTHRFDLDLYAIDTNHIAEGLQKLSAKYPDFLNYYLDTVREYNIHGNFNDTVKGIREDVRLDLTFKDFVNLEDTIKKYYPDNKDIDDKLTAGFKFIKYYFPEAVVPRIIYLNMGLSKWPTFPVDQNTLCIGLDMFLGEQYPHYKAIGLPEYMLSHSRRSYIPVSLFSTYYRMSHPFMPDDKTLLDLMLQRGREQFFLHKILPHEPDSVLFGFTQTQINWCAENEALIYNFFIRQNYLYDKTPQTIMPYVHEGPFARGLEAADDVVKVSPGNVGSWLGYRIVASYMQQYPKTTLSELLNGHHDPARFLDSAKYKPR